MGRASAKLHRTQQALSSCVRRLEHDCGATLLEEYGRGIRLTEAGTWRIVTLLVENAVFLFMGFQLWPVVGEVAAGGKLWSTLGVAGIVIVLLVGIRFAAMPSLLWSISSSSRSRKVFSPKYQPRRSASIAAWESSPPCLARSSNHATYARRPRPSRANSNAPSTRPVSSHSGPLPLT